MVLEFAVPVTAIVVSSQHCSALSQNLRTSTPPAFGCLEQSASPLTVLIPRVAISFDRWPQQGCSAARARQSTGQIDDTRNTQCPAFSSGCSDRCDSNGSCFTDRTNRVKKGLDATFALSILR